MMAIKILLILSMKCTFMSDNPTKILACQEVYNEKIILEFNKLEKACKE